MAGKKAFAFQEWRDAFDYFDRYLQHLPEDDCSLSQMTAAAEHLASDPQVSQVRIRLAARVQAQSSTDEFPWIVLGELELPDDPVAAAAAAQQALKRAPSSVRAKRLRANALEECFRRHGRRYANVVTVVNLYRELAADDPTDADLILRRACLMREYANEISVELGITVDELGFRADALVDDFTRNHPKSAAARLMRYHYRRSHHRETVESGNDLDRDLAAAIELEPQNLEINLQGLNHFIPLDFESPLIGYPPARELSAVESELANERLAVIEKLAPHDWRTVVARAQLHWSLGEIEEAVETMRRHRKRDEPRFWCRLAEAEIHAGDFDRALESLGLAKQAIPSDAASTVVSRSVVHLLEAHLLIAEKNLSANAAKALAALRQAKAGNPLREAPTSIAIAFGRCYAALGQWDQAGTAFWQAIRGDESGIRAKRAYALTLAEHSRFAEAAQVYLGILRQPVVSLAAQEKDEVWHSLLCLEIQSQFAREPTLRDWQRSQSLYTSYRADVPLTVRQLSIELELAFAQEGASSGTFVLRRLTETESLLGRYVEYWELAFETQLRLGRYQNAELALRQIERRLGSEQAPRREALALAQREPTKASALEMPRVTFARSAAYISPDSEEITASGKTSSPIDESLAEIEAACRKRDEARLRKITDRIRAEKIHEPSLADYAEIRRLLLLAQGKDPQMLKRAMDLKARLASAHPSHAATHLAQGAVAASQEKWSQGAQSFKLAVQLGQRDMGTAFHYLRCLIWSGQSAEARDFLLSLAPAHQRAPDILPFTVSLLRAHGLTAEACRICKETAGDDPSNVDARLLLIHALAGDTSADSYDQVMDELEQIRQLAPGDIRIMTTQLFCEIARPGKRRLDRCLRMLCGLTTALSDSNGMVPESSCPFYATGYGR